MAENNMNEIPLADDESHPTSLDKVKNAKPALPLPEQEDQEEKARLIAQILELQNTLQDLSQRVESVRDESVKLRSENLVLGRYIKNLMDSSSLFQPTNVDSEEAPKRYSSENDMFEDNDGNYGNSFQHMHDLARLFN